MKPHREPSPSSPARTRTWLVLFALATVVVVVVALCWALRAREKTTGAAVASTTAGVAERDLNEPDLLSLESVPSTAHPIRVSNASSEARPGQLDSAEMGSIVGVVRSLDPSAHRVTGGFARFSRAAGSHNAASDEMDFRIATPFVLIDDSGWFKMPRVPLGDWIVLVEPDGFVRQEQRVKVANTRMPAAVEFTVQRALSTSLTVVLRESAGEALFDAMSDFDREVAFALRPALLRTCPTVGAELGEDADFIERFHAGSSSETWKSAHFKEPTAGCACVLIGRRVLDAVPFVAGQEQVEVRVSLEALREEKCAIEVFIVDEERQLPIVDAHVNFFAAVRGVRSAVTGPDGRCRFDAVFAGPCFVEVAKAGFANQRVERRLVGSSSVVTLELALGPGASVRGRVNCPGRNLNGLPLTFVRIGQAGSPVGMDSRYAETETDGLFEIDGLPVGAWLIGVQTQVNPPEAARVRANEIHGWKFVELRKGEAPFVELDVDERAWEQLLAGWLDGSISLPGGGTITVSGGSK